MVTTCSMTPWPNYLCRWLHFLGTVLVTSCTYVLIYVLDLKTETAVATSKKQFRCKNWELDVHSRNDVPLRIGSSLNKKLLFNAIYRC